jgi:hypothetical protein
VAKLAEPDHQNLKLWFDTTVVVPTMLAKHFAPRMNQGGSFVLRSGVNAFKFDRLSRGGHHQRRSRLPFCRPRRHFVMEYPGVQPKSPGGISWGSSSWSSSTERNRRENPLGGEIIWLAEILDRSLPAVPDLDEEMGRGA